MLSHFLQLTKCCFSQLRLCMPQQKRHNSKVAETHKRQLGPPVSDLLHQSSLCLMSRLQRMLTSLINSRPYQDPLGDISSYRGNTAGFHLLFQTWASPGTPYSPWDPRHWTHQNLSVKHKLWSPNVNVIIHNTVNLQEKVVQDNRFDLSFTAKNC